jgi:hypothetical protein
MAAWSEARTVFIHSETGNVGSNSARGMDVCPLVCVLCCPVAGVAVRLAELPYKESYQMSNRNMSI